jgi:hypothetical protein
MNEVYFNLYLEQNKMKKAVLKDQLLHVQVDFLVSFSTWKKYCELNLPKYCNPILSLTLINIIKSLVAIFTVHPLK